MDPFTKFSNHFSMPDEFMGKHGGKIEMFGVMDTLNISRISRFNYVVFFFFFYLTWRNTRLRILRDLRSQPVQNTN